MASNSSLLHGTEHNQGRCLAVSSCTQRDQVQVGLLESIHILTWCVARQMASLCWALRRWCQSLAQALVHPHLAGQLLLPAPLPSPAGKFYFFMHLLQGPHAISHEMPHVKLPI